MACDELNADLTTSAPSADLAGSSRAGALGQVASRASGGFCRAFTFAPPVTIPPSQIVTFANEPIVTFAGDYLYSF